MNEKDELSALAQVAEIAKRFTMYQNIWRI